MADFDLEAIQARADAAQAGPWFWRGNVDYSDPSLCYYREGWGRAEILWHIPRERTAKDVGAKDYAQYLGDSQISNGNGGWRAWTEEEIAEEVRANYLEDPRGEPATDNRMVFTNHENLNAIDARELAIFEVAPKATKRDDPKVYRADIVGIRHSDAVFIAAARKDVDDLLAEVRRLRALVGEEAVVQS